MHIFDAHCDVLYKMWLDPTISFQSAKELHITGKQLQMTNAKVQCFAIYIPESVRPGDQYEVALEMVDIFFNKVLGNSPLLKHVKTKNDIKELKKNEIGAILTLEGCDAIGTSLIKYKTLLRLGVSSVGLTWNYANAVSDGILEERGAGLSTFGKKVVRENNLVGAWTDVSHISEQGFWDVLDLANYPIASHSNAYRICNHPRNLNDAQIKAIISKGGMIGVTFVPQFLTNTGDAQISDVLKHIDYICGLGGEFNLGFGSDFDGITETVKGLSSYQDYDHLINLLLKYYTEDQVKRFMFINFVEHLPV